jgi:exodeoxyribonuclease-3
MKIISWNVNGLRAIHKKGFLEWVAQADPDILCLQETKAQPEQLPEELLKLDHYHPYFSPAARRGYSGVALYSKVKPAKVQNGFGVDVFDREGRTIIADFKEFILINVYFPNGGASVERLHFKLNFYDAFLDYIDDLKEKGKKLIICGDVNTAHKEIDLARPKENQHTSGFLPKERAWIDKLIDHGFIDTFRMFNQGGENYTWWDYKTRSRERNVGWRLDYFFISENLKKKVKSSPILSDVMGSDHCPVGLEIE